MPQQNALSLLTQCVIAIAIGIAVHGFITYTTFHHSRTESLLTSAYEDAKAAEDVNKALDQVFLGPVATNSPLSGLYTPIPENLKADYEAAKSKPFDDKEGLDTFFQKNLVPFWWGWWAYMVLTFGAGYLLTVVFRPVFQKATGKMAFTMTVIGMLSGYFAFLTFNNIYPMGIDLAGGTELIYELDTSEVARRIEGYHDRVEELRRKKEAGEFEDGKVVTDEKINTMRETIQSLEDSLREAPDKATDVVRQRVDPTGTKGVPITKYGEDRIRIQLPKASPEDVERIKRAIRTQGRLTFHIVTDSKEVEQKTLDSATKEYGDYMVVYQTKKDPYDPNAKPEKIPHVVEKAPMLEGSRIVYATHRRSQEGGYEINIQFDPAGAAKFEEVTGNNVGKQMAIILDGDCKSAPTIQERIAGQCRISGSFDLEEAKELSSVLTAGSLPARVENTSEFTVGPSLGHEQIESGIAATLIGAGLVALFIWIYYRLAGFVSVICLTLNLLTLLGALGFFKATMTLPGIAGILLTLGMAVDANVLIFERIREELARGRPLRLATQHGFDRAVVTILDSQLTTLLSGIILYYLGTGPVRGFAVTLSLGILVTLFTNLWVCRLIFDWLVSRDAIGELKMMQIIENPSFNFMKHRKVLVGVSSAMIVVSLAAFAYLGVVKDSIYDLDFTGGTLVQFNFAPGKEQDRDLVREKIEKELTPKLRQRLGEVAATFHEVANSGKQGPELRDMLYEKLPNIGRSQFGPNSEISTAALTEMAAGLEKVLEDFDTVELVAQSFGDPTEAGTYRSYTVTSRLTEQIAVEIMDDEVKHIFRGQIEPEAVEMLETEGKKALRIRFERAVAEEAAAYRDRLVSKIDSMAASSDFAELQKELAALQIGPMKNEEGDETHAGGHPYVDLTQLPENNSKLYLLEATFREAKIEGRAEGAISRKNTFGNQVSGEMRRSAFIAMLAAMAGIFVYLWFRFEFSGAWGFGAIAALFHDASLAIGAVCFVYVTGTLPILIDLNLVAAILTIIGYSVNDTIVTFDRIREIRTQHPTRDLEGIINDAINATLSRTLLTSSTTLLATLALFLFGGPTIRDLSFTLLVGIFFGTYSSISIAAPAYLWWINKYGAGVVAASNAAAAKKGGGDASPSGAQI